MRDTLLITALLLAGAVMEFVPAGRGQEVAGRAQELLKEARAALGGEKLKALRSLSASGSFRRVMGEREMSGEITLDLLLPDKFMKSETMSPFGGVEVTRIEAMSGEKAWSDTQSSGGHGGMVIVRRPGGDTPQGEAAQQQAVRAEFARLLLGWLLTAPASFPVEFSYAGQAEAPDGKADVLEVKGPDRFAARLFLDQQTHRPLMLSYKGRQPRIVVNTFSSRASGHEGGEKRIKPEEIEQKVKEAEAQAAAAAEVEFQVYFAEYRDVNGISFPHRLTKSVKGEVNEEWELVKFKLNPALKPEKFEKK
jgi:hypothetical protein